MRLVRESSGANGRGGDTASCPSVRGSKWCFRIIGTEDEAKLIEAIDNSIGDVIKCINGLGKELTWRQEFSDYCADYVWGTGCGWWVDIEDVEEFKNLYKKHKKIIMTEAKAK